MASWIIVALLLFIAIEIYFGMNPILSEIAEISKTAERVNSFLDRMENKWDEAELAAKHVEDERALMDRLRQEDRERETSEK